MGNALSTPSPLNALSSEDIATAITSKGTNYASYGVRIKDNGIDGELLASLADEDLVDFFEELGISSKIHRKVLANMLAKAKDAPKQAQEALPDPMQQAQEAIPATLADPLRNPQEHSQHDKGEDDLGFNQEYDFGHATEIGLTSASPDDDLEEFDLIAQSAFESDTNNVYSGVHLMLADGYQHPLGSRYRVIDDILSADRSIAHVPLQQSTCFKLVQDETKDYMTSNITVGSLKLTYRGYVIKTDEGDRVGTVCMSSPAAEEGKDSNIQKEQLLEQLAMFAKYQLKKKKALVEQRNALEENNKVLDSSLFMSQNLATEEEKAHLPPDFWDLADSMDMPHAPIHKDDMKRVAAIERLGLLKMDPNGTLAITLTRLLTIASRLGGFPLATMNILDHEKQHCICSVVDGTSEHNKRITDIMNSMEAEKTDLNGNLFMCAIPRCAGMCNYTLHKGKTFIVKDITTEREANIHKVSAGMGFGTYLSIPIRASEGFVVATICFLDIKPHEEIKPMLVEQLESIGKAVEQEIDNWALQREMDKLEQDQAALFLHNSLSGAPRTYTPSIGEVSLCIVSTEIQGLETLWERNPNATEVALKIHDSILRSCCARANGYEMTSVGRRFQLAFQDQIDAVMFALEVQAKLYNASWEKEILVLPDASIDAERKFRGLRVKIGIHHGPVTTTTNHTTGRVACVGKHAMMSKSLLEMTQGGQILVTSDVWSVACGLSEALGSPQVLDMGEHVLKTGSTISEGIISKSVLQLLPESLAFDFSSARSGSSCDNAVRATGRRFVPAMSSKFKLGPSFFDAPQSTGPVTIVQLDVTEGLSKLFLLEEVVSKRVLSTFQNAVKAQLTKPKGYECSAIEGVWVLAFESIESALTFSLSLKDALHSAPFDSIITEPWNLLKVGIYRGNFSSVRPHAITGRAQYSGTVGTRAARVAREAPAGGVLVGIREETVQTVDWGSAVTTLPLGVKDVEGISEPVALFSCSWEINGEKWRKLARRRESSRKERKRILLERRGLTTRSSIVQVKRLLEA